MKKKVSWEQLARYFAGELSDKERQKIESWIDADPKRKRQVKELYDLWEESSELPYEVNIETAWRTLSGEIEKQEKGILHNQTEEQPFSIRDGRTAYSSGEPVRRVFLAIAAVLLLTIGLFSYYGGQKDREGKGAYRELVAQKGERVTYVLKDGSHVILHAGSHLKVPRVFGTENRELYLEGEAYFDVTTDSAKPFIVHSQNVYTRVLGTRFLIKAWSGSERKVEVVVAEGKVALGSELPLDTADKQEAILTKNQKGVLAGNQKPVVIDHVDLEWYLGWTKGRLVFDNRPLSEIVPRLERWYGIDIKTEDQSIDTRKLTAEIDYSQPMGEVLQNIALALDLEVERDDWTVTFSRIRGTHSVIRK